MDRITFYPITNMVNSEWNIIASWHSPSMLSLHNYSYEATAKTFYSTTQSDIKYPGFLKYPIMYDEGNGPNPIVAHDRPIIGTFITLK